MDNVQLKEEYISNQYYPTIKFTFEYTEGYYNTYQGYVFTDYEIEIDGSDYNDYNYNQNEDFLGFEYDLLNDNGGGSAWFSYYYKYTDFRMTIEAEFSPTITTMNGTTFSCWYSHQIGSGYIDWGNISVSQAPPYFSYSTSFWVDDSNFDDGIGGHIIFQDIG